MSDNPFEFFMRQFGSPEEMKEARIRDDMESTATAHEIADFFRGLSASENQNMQVILYIASRDKQWADSTMGILAGIAESKHGICIGCRKNHEKELLPDIPEKSFDDDGFQTLPESERPEMMKLFGLRYPGEGEVAAAPDEYPVICRNCNSLYQSLEDRMRRPPGIDGCQGCQHKSAHG